MRTRSWNMCHLFALGCALVLLLCGFVSAETNSSSMVSDESGSSDSIKKGMKPLYDMTNTFLEIVQPESKGSYFQKYDIHDLGNFTEQVRDDFSTFAKHYGGYMGCIIVGFMFVVFMPLAGLIFCCCRCCCGNCGGRPGEPGKSDRCQRVTCGIILAVFATIMLASIVCAFVTNDLLRKQTAKDDADAFLPQIQMSLSDLDSFAQNVVTEIEELPDEVESRMIELLEDIKAIPEEVKVQIGEKTKAEALIQQAEVLATSVSTINESLSSVYKFTKQLVKDGDTLNTQLANLKTDLRDTLNKPACTSCSGIDADAIQTEADYNQVDNVTQQLRNVTEIINANISGLVQQGRQDFENITTEVLQEIQQQIDQADENIEELVNEIQLQTKEETDDIRDLGFNDYIEDINEYKDQVEEYGNYRFYAGIALSCILLLIVLFYYMGLCFGVLGETPDEDAPCCNRGVGANLLMAGVAFSFLFSWLLMLVTIIMFLTGGLMHTEVCRNVRDLENSTAAEYADRVLGETLSLETESGLDIEIAHILRTCEADGTLYIALNLEERFNITEIILSKNAEIEQEIQELRDQNIQLDDTKLLTSETRRQLEKLRDTDLDDIDFSSFEAQSAKDFVSVSLPELAIQLDTLADAQTDSSIKTELMNHAATVRNIENGLVLPMEVTENSLQGSLEDLKRELQGSDAAKKFADKVQDLINELEAAEQSIKTDGQALINEALDDLATSLEDEIERLKNDLVYKVKYEKGKCRSAYDSLSNAVDATCVNLLYPYNGFWFSFGWSLFFFIPCIIAAACLATIYRRVDDYSSHKGLDEPNYDAYGGAFPGDNIPLEDMNRHKPQRPAYQGQSNPGYIREVREDYSSRGQQNNGAVGYDYRGGYNARAQPNPASSGGAPYQNRYYPQGTSTPPNPPHYYNHRGKYY